MNKSGGQNTTSKSTPMTKSDASRIQSGIAKSGGNTGTNSWYARAQSAGDRNANAAAGSGASSTSNTAGKSDGGASGGAQKK